MSNADAHKHAVCMGMDAMRICLGMMPKNFTAQEVISWMRTVLDVTPHATE